MLHEAPPQAAKADAIGRNLQGVRIRCYLWLMLTDTMAIAGAFILASTIRFGLPFSEVGIRTFVVIWPFYLGLAFNARAFSVEALRWPRRSAYRAIIALLLAVAAVALTLFALKAGEDFSRLVFGIGSATALFLLVIERVLVGRFIGKRYNWIFRNEVLLVDGVDADPAGTERIIFAGQEGLAPTPTDPAMLDRLGQLVGNCDRVILACPFDRRQAWADMLKGASVDVEIVAPEIEQIGALEMRHHDRRTTLLVACGPISLRDRTIKRTLDLLIATPAFIVIFPFMLLIAAAIRIGSSGRVLFRQQRMGHGNRMFQMLKFRTMRQGATDADGSVSTSRDDERVTRIGSFLRRTSLDELPQLWNVLRGDMSIVGPRPHALGSTAEDEHFWNIDKRYWDRHAIKPGMTGLAQVRGFRGATDTREDLTDRLQADLEYLSGWTLGRDLMIIARTAMVLVHKKAF